MDCGTASSLLTSAGNPVCARAGLTMLDILLRDNLASRAEQMGALLREEFSRGVSTRGLHCVVGDVRGRGMTIGIDLVANGSLAEPDPVLARKAVYRAWQLGAVVFYVGGNVLEVTPPLTLSIDEAHEGVAILLEAISTAHNVTDAEVAPFSGW